MGIVSGRKEMFNDTLNTFYLRLYGRKSHKCSIQVWRMGIVSGRKEMFNDTLNTFYLPYRSQ